MQSLELLGINPLEHDIRFVEDNWENPSTGSAGLGWEVWLDGMEITQFTYFQQVGGLSTDPVTSEVTYGLERHPISKRWIPFMILSGQMELSTAKFSVSQNLNIQNTVLK